MLNSWSPFKDAYKNDAPNFMPDSIKDHELKIRSIIEKARPPSPPILSSKLNSTEDRNSYQNNYQEKENKIEGNFMFLVSPHDGAGVRNDTSLDSMDTDQIFMTYVENDNKSTCDEAHQEFKYKQEMIENEIEKIKQNLQMPTIETEEDDKTNDDNEVLYKTPVEESKMSTFHTKKNKTANLESIREYEWINEEKHNKSSITFIAKPKSLFNPLWRKVIYMEYDSQADVAEAKHWNSTTGFILAPTIKFEKESSEDRYIASGVIQHKDDGIILNRLLNASILKSFAWTPIKILSWGFEHWAVLTTFGTIATWGYGASGCLGHNSYTSYTSPKLIQNPIK